MPNILIRGLPEEAVAEFDLRAEQLGLSRNEFLKRKLLSGLRADFVYAEHAVTGSWDWGDLRELTDTLSNEEIEEMVDGKGPYLAH